MTDQEWSFFEHFILANRTPNERKPTNPPLVLESVFWIARTRSPWRNLPEDFGEWSSVNGQFRRWTLARLWEDPLEVLNQSGATLDVLQMIDSTVIRTHHQVTGANGALHNKVSAVQEVASQPRTTSTSMAMACQ